MISGRTRSTASRTAHYIPTTKHPALVEMSSLPEREGVKGVGRTVSELRQVDFSGWFHPHPRPKGTRLPQMERGQPRLPVHVFRPVNMM